MARRPSGTVHMAEQTQGAPTTATTQSPQTAPAVMPSRTGRVVASFLRVMLIPVITVGIPFWPVLAVLCAVPIVGIFTIPLFILLTALLLYSVAWFSYLLLAQSDPPPSSISPASYLPFLPYSPLRCLKVNWAAFLYAVTALRLVFPAALDWCYRRVMVLGTQGGGGVVKEGILYGSHCPGKRLDVYLPPARASSSSPSATQDPGLSAKSRRHSTYFTEPATDPNATPRPDSHSNEPATSVGASVIVFLPSPVPPLTWTNKRKMYLQLALRLRRMGYCVVVPDITTFPEARIRASITDLRLVLRWVAQNSERYGGDPRRIHLMGHGLSAHLAMLTLTQEAVVLSREGHLDRAYEREQMMVRWDQSEEDRVHGARNGDRQGAPLGLDGATVGDAWVDEPNDFTGHGLPPGAVMGATHRFDDAGRPGASIRAGAQLGHLENGNNAVRAGARGTQQGYGSTQTGAQTLEEAEAEIGNGLRRVEIYEPEVELPHIAGVILLAGVSDVIKGFRNESDRGVEHLSSLRRAMGPSHTSCLLHSPAHLLYAAKNILDISLLPPKFLLIHGGKDAVVPVEQSTLMKTLLVGVGVEHVRLRAYRDLGHAESVASLFLGMGRASTRYSRQILQDITDFVSL